MSSLKHYFIHSAVTIRRLLTRCSYSNEACLLEVIMCRPLCPSTSLHLALSLALELLGLALGLALKLLSLALSLAGHLLCLALGLAGGVGGGFLNGASDFLCSKGISICFLMVLA